MNEPAPDAQVLSMRCLVAEPGASYDWHSHPFEEFTLLTDDEALIGYENQKRPQVPNTLCLYLRGEVHGGWCGQRQRPKFWVVHFIAGPELCRPLERLREPDPHRRVWRLSDAQAETYKWIFLHLLHERVSERAYHGLAEAAWLRLLLISVQRWADGRPEVGIGHGEIKPELMQLWQAVNASVANPADFVRHTRSLPNYDSLRHQFKKAFGCSPRKSIGRLRMQQAKNLLLETTLSIKEIADRLGYTRQHEFTRAFHKEFGISPSEWRTDPFQRSFTMPPQ